MSVFDDEPVMVEDDDDPNDEPDGTGDEPHPQRGMTLDDDPTEDDPEWA